MIKIKTLLKNKNMVIAVAVGIVVGVIAGFIFPGSGLSEYLIEILIQTCCAGVGFAAGALWMRENYLDQMLWMREKYIDRITKMQNYIKELENKENYYERNYCNF